MTTNLKNAYYFIATSILIVVAMFYLKFALIPLCFGALLAILINPVILWIQKFVKIHILAYLMVTILLLIIFGIPLTLISLSVVSLVEDQSLEMVDVSNTVADYRKTIETSQWSQYIDMSNIKEILASGASKVQELMTFVIVDSVSFITNAGLAILFSYFLSAYYTNAKRKILEDSNRVERKRIKEVISRIPTVLRSYVFGTGLVMLIISICTYVLFLMVGLDHALLWSVIIGLLTIIPFIGSAIGIMLPLGYSLMQNGSVSEFLIILFGYLIIQQIEGNFITPKIVGDKVGLNPFIIIISMLLLSQVWGIAGVMLTIPIVAVMKVLLEEYQMDLLAEIVFSSKENNDNKED